MTETKPQPLGAVYLAFGKPYLAMALVSIESLKQTNPELPVCVLTNVCDSPPAFEFWDEQRDTWSYIAEPSSANRRYKTAIAEHTPYEKTIFIDCDTMVLGELSLAAVLLDHFDLALKQQPRGQRRETKGAYRVLDGRAQVSELPHWNSGVVMFRANGKVREFFRLWGDYYEHHGAGADQVSLVDAVFRSDCRVLSLDNRWNASFARPGRDGEQAVRILHYGSRIPTEVKRRMSEVAELLPVHGPYGCEVSIEDYLAKRDRSRFRKHGFVRYYRDKLRQWLHHVRR